MSLRQPIHGQANANKLVITVYNVANDTVRYTFEFQPRVTLE
jgi:hypothetical protein